MIVNNISTSKKLERSLAGIVNIPREHESLLDKRDPDLPTTLDFRVPSYRRWEIRRYPGHLQVTLCMARGVQLSLCQPSRTHQTLGLIDSDMHSSAGRNVLLNSSGLRHTNGFWLAEHGLRVNLLMGASHSTKTDGSRSGGPALTKRKERGDRSSNRSRKPATRSGVVQGPSSRRMN